MRLQWKHRFLTTVPPGKPVHSILKNISFQKKKVSKGGRQGRNETGDRTGKCVIIVFVLQTETPWVWILFSTEEFFSSAHILRTAVVEEGASVLCLFIHLPFVLSNKLVKK